jgi:hypothetical protein
MDRLRLGTFVMLTVFALLAAACTSAGSATAPPNADGGGRLSGGPTAGEAADQDPDQPPTSDQVADQLLMVYTGSLSLEVSELRPAMDQAEQLIRGLGGHVASSSLEDSGHGRYATVTYRIPADRWVEALAGLRGVGTRVVTESTDSEDVTSQVVDIDARIANLRASEAALQEIMNRAGTIDDVLEVQRELTKVRSDIESMTAQRDLLANRAALATLEVTFGVPVVASSVAAQGWDLGQEVDNALAALVRLGQGLASLAVWLLIVVVPVLIPAALLLYLAFRLRRRWLSGHPPGAGSTLPPAPPPGPWGTSQT